MPKIRTKAPAMRRLDAAPLRFADMPTRILWEEFHKTRSKRLRDALVERYIDFARSTAQRVHRGLPSEVDVEDLMQAGMIMLEKAIEAFDPARKVKFETYCRRRIEGAVLDELRRMDWATRPIRARGARMEQARSGLEMELGRPPTEDEIGERLGVDEVELARIRRDARSVRIYSLHGRRRHRDSDRDVCEIDLRPDHTQANPLAEIEHGDVKDAIIRGFTRAEQLIIVLYYYENLTMKEIGLTLDLSESRICQMHHSILNRLRAQVRSGRKTF